MHAHTHTLSLVVVVVVAARSALQCGSGRRRRAICVSVCVCVYGRLAPDVLGQRASAENLKRALAAAARADAHTSHTHTGVCVCDQQHKRRRRSSLCVPYFRGSSVVHHTPHACTVLGQLRVFSCLGVGLARIINTSRQRNGTRLAHKAQCDDANGDAADGSVNRFYIIAAVARGEDRKPNQQLHTQNVTHHNNNGATAEGSGESPGVVESRNKNLTAS